MRDRLKELKEKSAVTSSGDDREEGSPDPRRGSIVVYMDRRNTLTAVEDSFMDDFFHEVGNTREEINNIEKHVIEIRRLHTKILSSPRTDPAIQLELEDRMASVKSISVKVRKTLKVMGEKLEEHEINQRFGTKNSNSSEVWTEAEFRIRRTQHSALSLSFKDALTKFTNIQMEYRDKHKEWLRRQMRIVKGEPTDDELEDIMEKGEGYIFTEDILAQTLEARQALADVQARHDEIIQIEKSIRDLRDLFLEMAMLVERQGEMIDNIEYHVCQTTQHTEKAKKEVSQAKELKSQVRKKKIIIIVILTLVAIVVALILYFTLAPL